MKKKLSKLFFKSKSIVLDKIYFNKNMFYFEPTSNKITVHFNENISNKSINIKYRFYKNGLDKGEWKVSPINSLNNLLIIENLESITNYVFELFIGNKEFTYEVMTTHHDGISRIKFFKLNQLSWNKILLEFQYLAGSIETNLEYSIDEGLTWRKIIITKPFVTGDKRILLVDKRFKSKFEFRYSILEDPITYEPALTRFIWSPIIKLDINKILKQSDDFLSEHHHEL